ncbi:MAG: UDP-N-acetylmuramate dehydrogenase [Oscillospiraceae bacterium]|jgi:UDP-N-acetylmuramate dehydrogenase|nr:UDP-N-acetylmuramate dehydrogenase [Oscillospiraceae bacterium]
MMHPEVTLRIRERFPGAAIFEREPASRWTTFRIGGPADALYIPRDENELAFALDAARSSRVPVTIIGNGSNLLVRDGGIRGLTIRVAGHPSRHDGQTALAGLTIDGGRIIAGAGASLSAAARLAADAGLTGMEPIGGIPGTVGGAALMNAGAYGGEISLVATAVYALARDDTPGDPSDRPEPIVFKGNGLAFRYRGSAMMDCGAVITRVEFTLKPDDPALIAERAADYARRRKSKQPLSEASAGSFFKRPPGQFAGALIESAGLKGFAVGGAMVSPMHAGFIINKGGATARDVLALKDEIIRRVFDHSGITLEPEVRVIGDDPS